MPANPEKSLWIEDTATQFNTLNPISKCGNLGQMGPYCPPWRQKSFPSPSFFPSAGGRPRLPSTEGNLGRNRPRLPSRRAIWDDFGQRRAFWDAFGERPRVPSLTTSVIVWFETFIIII